MPVFSRRSFLAASAVVSAAPVLAQPPGANPQPVPKQKSTPRSDGADVIIVGAGAAGIAAARRQGRWMHYRLVIPQDPVASSILNETLKHLRERPDMQRDYSRLDAACCQPGQFELPKKAPAPSLATLAVR